MNNNSTYAIVEGTSMYPFLKEGDIVVLKEKKTYSLGDIISYKQGFDIITHRVIYNSCTSSYITKGDNLVVADKAINQNYIIGCVVFILRKNENLFFVSKKLSKVFCLVSRIENSIFKASNQIYSPGYFFKISYKAIRNIFYNIYLSLNFFIKKEPLKK